jgi:hypothetical protein
MLYSPTVFFIEFIRNMLNKKNSSNEYSISKVYLTIIWVSVGIRKLRVHVFGPGPDQNEISGSGSGLDSTDSGLDSTDSGLDSTDSGLDSTDSGLDSTDSDPDPTWTRRIQTQTGPGLYRFRPGPDLDSTDSDPDRTWTLQIQTRARPGLDRFRPRPDRFKPGPGKKHYFCYRRSCIVI